MKTIIIGKKEYVVIDKAELDKVVGDVGYEMAKCAAIAEISKMAKDDDRRRDLDMDCIIDATDRVRERLETLVCKEV